MRVDRSSVRGKTDLKAERDITAYGIYAACCPLQDFLPGTGDSDEPAFTGTVAPLGTFVPPVENEPDDAPLAAEA